MSISKNTLSKTKLYELDMEVVAGKFRADNFLLNPETGYTPEVYDIVVLNTISGEHEKLNLDEQYIVDEAVTLIATTIDLANAVAGIAKVTDDPATTVYTPGTDYTVTLGSKAIVGLGSIGATDDLLVTYEAITGKEIVGMILEVPSSNNNVLMYTKSEEDGYLNLDKVFAKGGVENYDADNKKYFIQALKKLEIIGL